MMIPRLKNGFYAVFAEDLRLDMRLGVYPEEVAPQPVRIDMTAIVSRLQDGDGIEDVVDYNLLRDTALSLAEERHFGLQETYCETMIQQLTQHANVHGVIIQTRKLSAFADCAAIGCHMEHLDPTVLAG